MKYFQLMHQNLDHQSSAWRGIVIAMVTLFAPPAWAQMDFEKAPINYNEPTNDPISQLQARVDAGELALTYDPNHGYLKSLLAALNVPESSQMLVFSKTSFQLRKISPKRPRAIYFNDNTYIGWVQNGDVIEISTTDPKQGAIFYTLSQEADEPIKFLRDQGTCLTCHASSKTQGVPGHLVRSVFVDPTGQPRYGSGTYRTDHSSPFEKRWGGWYVSGTHGAMRHMGNVLSEDRSRPEDLNREQGANLKDLSEIVNVEPYLKPTSDLVALMVLEHQTQMHNFITAASYEARSAMHYDSIMNAALDRDPDYQSESTQRRIETACEKLLRYMLFSDEFPLEDEITGVSTFAKEFQSQGPRDSQGRSLRDLDLKTRIFKYPCSYLIYSESFDHLPVAVKQYLGRRLREILSGNDTTGDFIHLSNSDLQTILEILTETKPELFEST